MGEANSKDVSVTQWGSTQVLEFEWLLSDLEKLTTNSVGYTVTKDVVAPGDPKHSFTLCLYPCGFNERTKSYLGIFLRRKSDQEVAVRLTCSIVGRNGEEFFRRSAKKNLALETVVGWTTFSRKNLILEKKVNFSYPKLKCKIEIFQSVLSVEDEEDDLRSLQELSDNFQGLLDGGQYSDFVLKVDGESLNVHRSVLSARSPVFKAMLSSPLQDRQKETRISDVSFEAMKILVNFVYTGRLDFVDVPRAMEVYYAGDKYEIYFLRDACSKVLANNLQPDNVIDILLLAYRHSDAELQEQCLGFMDKNLREIKGREEWLELMKNHPQLADKALFFREHSTTSG